MKIYPHHEKVSQGGRGGGGREEGDIPALHCGA